MGWQTYTLYGAVAIVVVVIAYISRRMLRREARKTGADREAREHLEETLEAERRADRLDGQPIPLSRREQLGRLRALFKRLPRRRSGTPTDDE